MHRQLKRQLRRFELDAEALPVSLEQWQAFLERVSSTYDDEDRSRYMHERSLKLSSEEMQALHNELKTSNQDLKAWVAKLEQRNQEMVLLNKMGDMLQSCHKLEETYGVVCDLMHKLFPQSCGQFILQHTNVGHFVVVAQWGEWEDESPSPLNNFMFHECWGLRRSRVHIHDHGEDSACHHVKTNHIKRYICSPLIQQGEKLGLLHLRQNSIDSSDDESNLRFLADEGEKRLIQTVTEHVGLAVANLRLQETLRHQSLIDPLTGLYNRRHMDIALEREAARASRNKSLLGLVMLDVDHFKRFNDQHGHQLGDALLKKLGMYLKSQIRTEDIACRYGGEEFILIMPDIDPKHLCVRAEEIRSSLQNSVEIESDSGEPLIVTISLGVTLYSGGEGSISEAIEQADHALYSAKEGGRNRVDCSWSTNLH